MRRLPGFGNLDDTDEILLEGLFLLAVKECAFLDKGLAAAAGVKVHCVQVEALCLTGFLLLILSGFFVWVGLKLTRQKLTEVVK